MYSLPYLKHRVIQRENNNLERKSMDNQCTEQYEPYISSGTINQDSCAGKPMKPFVLS